MKMEKKNLLRKIRVKVLRKTAGTTFYLTLQINVHVFAFPIWPLGDSLTRLSPLLFVVPTRYGTVECTDSLFGS